MKNTEETALAILGNRAAGDSLRVVKLALNAPPSSNFPSLIRPEEVRHIPEVIQTWEARLRPLSVVEPKFNGSEARRVRDAFAPIGTKMRPDMSPDQAQHWTAAIVATFSDLPPWIAVEALTEAWHIPHKFPSDMETTVREIADRKLDQHYRAIRRLQAFLDQLRNKPVVELEAPQEDETPLSLDEVRALANSPGGKTLVRMGVKTNAIRAEDAAIVLGELPEDQCLSEEKSTTS